MIKTVEEYMEQYHMVEEGDTIVAGVSGGADSVCLFYILKEYCKKKNAELVVVHLNHSIREDAAADAAFVQKLCAENNIKFYLFKEDIRALAEEKSIGLEEAGRNARYAAFEKIRTQYGKKSKIAVAHNQNDCAETTLFHLIRGSGIAGLSGIMPVRGHIIRPLLCVERREIEEYLTQNEKTWCIDSTNAENTYTRNKIRNIVFPYLEKEISSQAIRHVSAAAQEAALIRSFVEETAYTAEKTVLEREQECVKIRIPAFKKENIVIQKQIILNALSYLVSSRKDMGAVHIRDILSLFEKDSGKQIRLPYGLFAMREFDFVVIAKSKESNKTEIRVSVPGKIEYESGKFMEFTLFSANINRKIPQKTYTKWFDYDKISNCPILRNRESGDYLTIKDGKHKTIKEYFIDEKIPRTERENKLLLADGSHIIWVVGMRISEAYKVTENTKNVLQVTVSVVSE